MFYGPSCSLYLMSNGQYPRRQSICNLVGKNCLGVRVVSLECISSFRSPWLEIRVNWFSNELNNPNSMFDFWFFYEALRGSGNIHFPWKSTWGNQASKKVAFSCLDSYIRKFLTLENLIKRNIILVNWVSMYKSRGNQLIIFYFTAQMPVSYGPLSTLLFI